MFLFKIIFVFGLSSVSPPGLWVSHYIMCHYLLELEFELKMFQQVCPMDEQGFMPVCRPTLNIVNVNIVDVATCIFFVLFPSIILLISYFTHILPRANRLRNSFFPRPVTVVTNHTASQTCLPCHTNTDHIDHRAIILILLCQLLMH